MQQQNVEPPGAFCEEHLSLLGNTVETATISLLALQLLEFLDAVPKFRGHYVSCSGFSTTDVLTRKSDCENTI